MTFLLAYLHVNCYFNIFVYGSFFMHIFYEYIWKMVNCALFIVVVLGLWL